MLGVRVVNVRRSFGSGERKLQVLDGVNLQVEPGQLAVLCGPSGSGKTTLLNLIGALDYPDEGELFIGKQNIARLSERARGDLRRWSIGFIFQNDMLLPAYTAQENIDLALRVAGVGYFERQQRARDMLAVVGLSAWASHVPDKLSGGQRQRIAIARALAPRPKLVLADEPTNGLDAQTSRHVLALFQWIARQQGTTFLIVSHDPLVKAYVDEAYDLDRGQLFRRHADEADDTVGDRAALHHVSRADSGISGVAGTKRI